VPIFFVLSGFSLAVVYGDREWEAPGCGRCQGTLEARHDGGKKGSYREFLFNRVVRIVPVYLLCTAVGVPLLFSGFGRMARDQTGAIVGTMVTSFTMTSTLLLDLLGYGLVVDGPAWFVQTLLFFYLLFPRFMRMAETRCAQLPVVLLSGHKYRGQG
jgi:peptidoglycan/LPS O-acetylase OafA/YrhL